MSLPTLVAGGCKRLTQAFHALTGEEEKKPAEPPPVPVVVGTVERRDVKVWGEWIGTVDGSVNAAIRPRVSGYLISQNYEEGSFLKANDLMFQIDPRPFVAALEHAKAALARTQAEQIKTQLDVDRLTPLVAKRAVSQQELDDAIGANEANLAMIEANKADIAIAELNLGFTKVIAPIDGIAGKANAQLGDLVGPASPEPLTSMSSVDPLTVYFFPTEREYYQAAEAISRAAATPLADRPDQFELVLSDGSIFDQRGRFYYADRQVDLRTGAIRVAVRFPNPGNLLRPGWFAKVKTVRKELPDAVVVPQRAVIDVQGSYQVAVVKPDQTVEMRNVTVGSVSGSEWVIAEGLQGGETIVVEGIQKVRAGVKVAPQTAAPTAGSATPKPSASATGAATGARSARSAASKPSGEGASTTAPASGGVSQPQPQPQPQPGTAR